MALLIWTGLSHMSGPSEDSWWKQRSKGYHKHMHSLLMTSARGLHSIDSSHSIFRLWKRGNSFNLLIKGTPQSHCKQFGNRKGWRKEPILQSVPHSLKHTWSSLLEEEPFVYNGAILNKPIPSQPPGMHERSTRAEEPPWQAQPRLSQQTCEECVNHYYTQQVIWFRAEF